MLCSEIDNYLPTFRNNLSGLILEGQADGTDALSRNVGNDLKFRPCKISEERRFHFHIGGNLISRISVDFTPA